MSAPSSQNRLATQTSPYLLQHAGNPVDWYPWGPEALARARDEDRPIFLSIGYAACHWCHVMERESFEDEETAGVLNEGFVSIKVDREERPDLDAIYMDAVQAMTGQGGWPLSAFLTPAGEPFYAGTYFPPEPRGGMPSFRSVLTAIEEAWRDRREEVTAQGTQITEMIARAAAGGAGGVGGVGGVGEDPLTPAAMDGILSEALDGLRERFDARWGGFGGAPKFPAPMAVEFLLRMDLHGRPDAREMAALTLTRMHEGGIYDHLGGGFARYSVDAAWHVPHFEKMLPDNAQLLRVLAQGWQVTGDEGLREAAHETAAYLLRDLRQPEGGFSSSQDADAGGIEGAFATWTWDQLTAVVSEDVAACLGATPEGNWHSPEGPVNVLWRPVPVATIATERGRDPGALAAEVEEGRRRLFLTREGRVRPATDDKVLAAWNGLAIRALAEVGVAMDEPSWIVAAEACARFCLEVMRDPDGKLLRSWRQGVGGVPAFADDHALLAAACLTLAETTFDPRWFDEGLALARELVERFRDPERGGFFQTAADAEPLVVRPKDLQDGALPSGNSAAAEVLLRLALLTGDATLEEAGRSALAVVMPAMGRVPLGFGEALCALDLARGPIREVAIVGDPDAPDTRALLAEVRRGLRPNLVLAVAAPGDDHAPASIPLLRGREQREGRATAYVCERFACKLPVTDPGDLAVQLGPPASTMEA